jgi:hypothetical protein
VFHLVLMEERRHVDVSAMEPWDAGFAAAIKHTCAGRPWKSMPSDWYDEVVFVQIDKRMDFSLTFLPY